MNKEDLLFHMICPECYQQDHLVWDNFKELVLNENRKTRLRPARIEGQYPCPYGCDAQMGLFAMGDDKETVSKSHELHKKYSDKLDLDQ